MFQNDYSLNVNFLKQGVNVMKKGLTILSLTAAIVSIACICSPIPIQQDPELIDSTALIKIKDSVSVKVHGYTTVKSQSGRGFTKHNEVQTDLIYGIAKGLATGKCWTGNTWGGIEVRMYNLQAHGYDIILWTESGQNADGYISYSGGTGSQDSVIYVGSAVEFPIIGIGWVPTSAKLFRGVIISTSSAYLATQNLAVASPDTVAPRDYYQVSWCVKSKRMTLSSSAESTDTLDFIIAQGVRADNMPYIQKHKYVYNNGDTVTRSVTNAIYTNTDTSHVWVQSKSNDTIRTRSNDTLLYFAALSSDNRVIVWDTLDRHIPSGKAASFTSQVDIIK